MPQQYPKSGGFTLVEIMIAISIIAILTVMGMAIFTGLLKQARDGKRISDIDAIYNALELHYDSSASQYPTELSGSWFTTSTIPADPFAAAGNRCGALGTGPCEYCFRNFGTGENECGAGDHDVSTNPNLFDQRGYLICASLEHKVNNLSYYCKHSARFSYN